MRAQAICGTCLALHLLRRLPGPPRLPACSISSVLVAASCTQAPCGHPPGSSLQTSSLLTEGPLTVPAGTDSESEEWELLTNSRAASPAICIPQISGEPLFDEDLLSLSQGSKGERRHDTCLESTAMLCMVCEMMGSLWKHACRASGRGLGARIAARKHLAQRRGSPCRPQHRFAHQLMADAPGQLRVHSCSARLTCPESLCW